MSKKNGDVIIKRGRNEVKGPVQLNNLIQLGAKLKEQHDNLKKELDAVNADILAFLKRRKYIGEVGSCHVIAGNIDCNVSIRESVKIKDAEALWAILGDRFHDLVREKKSYHPEPKLVKMIADADLPNANELRACIESKIGKPGFKYVKK